MRAAALFGLGVLASCMQPPKLPEPGPGAAGWPDIDTVPRDLEPPPMVEEAPAPGRRVRRVDEAYRGTEVHHALYLPVDWRPDRSYPVLVEYAGNGPYRNKWGDTSSGKVEDCVMGYGLSGGQGCLWLTLPYVSADGQRNQRQWWGDAEATIDYCLRVVPEVCERFGGDPSRVVLMGFSRGSIACNYLGLRNDAVAGLWRGFVCHSHYDGVRSWPYVDSDPASAKQRLARLGERPQFILQEQSVESIRRFLGEACPDGRFTFRALNYRNHTAEWTLRPTEERRLVREWLRALLAE